MRAGRSKAGAAAKMVECLYRVSAEVGGVVLNSSLAVSALHMHQAPELPQVYPEDDS